MHNYSKFIFSLSLIGVLCSCNGGGTNTNHDISKILPVSENSEIWGVNAAEKVVQDRSRSFYDYAKQDAEINIVSCKGEYELSQIVVSPSKKVSYFDAKITDLKTDDGFLLSKNNIELFGAKYLIIDKIWDTVTAETKGNFPDALIPIEALKKYNQNYIVEGMNQSFYVSVNTPINQRSGIYKGIFTLQLDDIGYEINVNVDIKDYVVSSKVHAKSLFLNDWSYESAELNSTQDELDRYDQEILKYRLSPDKILKQEFITHDDACIYRYTQKAYEYMQNEKCTNVSIPYATVAEILPNGQYDSNFNSDIMKKYIRSYYVKSIETNFNMFDKSTFYFGGLIDEPDDTDNLERVIRVTNLYKKTIKEIADELNRTGYKTNPIHNELIESILELKDIVTCAYSERFKDYIECWCPKANFYNTPEQRLNYSNQKEKWWYTCVYPRVPYPTYHIEDKLASSRLLSWMQAEYDVVGNLFWATNVYARYNGSQYMPIEDYYQDGYRFNGVNGDGFLFYPGKQFGLNYPLASTRLYSIRDGLEEYEMLYDLIQEYKKLDIDKVGLFKFLTRYLYDGTKVSASNQDVSNSRNDLINLLLANKNGSNFLIKDCEYNELEGNVSLTFYAKNGTHISVDNKELTSSGSYKDGILFNVTIKLEENSNIVDIGVKYDVNDNHIKHNVGGKIYTYSVNEINKGFSRYNASVTTSIDEISESENVVKLEVGEVTGKKQSIKYTPSFIDKITNDTLSISFTFYNYENDDVNFSLGGKFSEKMADYYLTENETLKAKELTTININLKTMNLKSSGSLDYLMFVLGDTANTKTEFAKTIGIKDIVISY